MEIKKVLFPTDFSDAANRALPHALAMAHAYQAEMIILHVALPYASNPNRPEYRNLDAGSYTRYVEEFVEASMGELSRRIDPGQGTTAVIRELSPAAGILDYISTHQIDLTVMGTHGRSAIPHFLLGSVAEKVVRGAPCPVLTIAPDRDDYRASPEPRNILVAFDLSEFSMDAARQAQELASRFDAHLRALYVIERDVPPPYYDLWEQAVSRGLTRIRAEVSEGLKSALGHDLEQGCVEVVTSLRKAYAEIAEFALSHQIDLIVLGAHGRTGLDRLLLGSTTERLVRAAPCPILTCKLNKALK